MVGMSEVDLQYVLGEKDDLLIVLFTGQMSSRAVSVIENCLLEVQKRQQKVVLFSFRDVKSVMPGVHVALTKLQKTVRDEKRILGLCFLTNEARASLIMAGIIRESEIYASVADAWRILQSQLQNVDEAA